MRAYDEKCEGCRHGQPKGQWMGWCWHPESWALANRNSYPCGQNWMRQYGIPCGPDAELYEQKDPAPEPERGRQSGGECHAPQDGE